MPVNALFGTVPCVMCLRHSQSIFGLPNLTFCAKLCRPLRGLVVSSNFDPGLAPWAKLYRPLRGLVHRWSGRDAFPKIGFLAREQKSPVQKFKIKLQGMDNMETAVFCVPFDVQEAFGTRARVPVCGTINGFAYRSSIMNMGSGHMMVVNRELREGAKVKAGDTVEIVMQRDTAPRVVESPPDFKEALGGNKKAKSLFDKLSYTHQKEYVRWITSAKREETRKSRIERAIEMLSEGVRTPD